MQKNNVNSPAVQKDDNQFFQIKMRNSKRHRFNIILVCIFCFFISSFGILLFCSSQNSFSEQENRTLKTLNSVFSVNLDKNILSGKFSSDFSDFCADQFPFRNLFVGIKGVIEFSLGKQENNNVLLGKNGYLISRLTSTGEDTIPFNYSAINDFAIRVGQNNVPVTLAVAGRTIDIVKSEYPLNYNSREADVPWSKLYDELENNINSVNFIDLRQALVSADENGESVMYRTDHHWTTKGAYLAYKEIMKSWEIEPLSEDFFDKTEVSDSFFGTTWRSAGFKWIQADSITFWRYEGDTNFSLTIPGDETPIQGFYDFSYLSQTDKYSSFISGNHGYCSIKKNTDENRETLLVIKDSFAHALIPFLAYHFDLEIVDLRYYKGSASRLVSDKQCSRVLFLYNMASLTDSTDQVLLSME